MIKIGEIRNSATALWNQLFGPYNAVFAVKNDTAYSFKPFTKEENPEKGAMLIAEKVWVLKQFVEGWWEEGVDLTPCNGVTPSESRILEIRTCGSMRGRRLKDLLLLR